MAVNVKHLVRLFREQAEALDESARIPNYRLELLRHLSAIIEAEQENRVRALPIQQRVAEECTRLGGKLEEGNWQN
jgi:hypothetical protein